MARKMYSKVVWPGFSSGPSQRHVEQVGRNDPCPCGSGKKYKKCHESEGTAYLQKLAREHDREDARKLRAKLKADGVPWYRRLFVGR